MKKLFINLKSNELERIFLSCLSMKFSAYKVKKINIIDLFFTHPSVCVYKYLVAI